MEIARPERSARRSARPRSSSESPVGEPGERVAHGLVGELALQGADLRDVATDAVQPVPGRYEAQLDHREGVIRSSERSST